MKETIYYTGLRLSLDEELVLEHEDQSTTTLPPSMINPTGIIETENAIYLPQLILG